jgi:hypothetical protein
MAIDTKKTNKAAIITVLRKDNPKSGKSKDRYQHYKTGMTVEQYCALAGPKGMADIRWDLERQFIKLTEPKA